VVCNWTDFELDLNFSVAGKIVSSTSLKPNSTNPLCSLKLIPPSAFNTVANISFTSHSDFSSSTGSTFSSHSSSTSTSPPIAAEHARKCSNEWDLHRPARCIFLNLPVDNRQPQSIAQLPAESNDVKERPPHVPPLSNTLFCVSIFEFESAYYSVIYGATFL